MKALLVRYQLIYSVTIRNEARTKLECKPGTLVVRDTVTLAPNARASAEQITIAGFLLIRARTEKVGRYTFNPVRVDVLSTTEVEDAVAPR